MEICSNVPVWLTFLENNVHAQTVLQSSSGALFGDTPRARVCLFKFVRKSNLGEITALWQIPVQTCICKLFRHSRLRRGGKLLDVSMTAVWVSHRYKFCTRGYRTLPLWQIRAFPHTRESMLKLGVLLYEYILGVISPNRYSLSYVVPEGF